MNSKVLRKLVVFSICMLLAGFYIFLVESSRVRADVGVHPVLPGGSNIEPDADTPIQMSSERVVMNVRLATSADNAILQLNPAAYGLNAQAVWYPAVAMVVADFTMHNPTTSTIDLTTWFPLASALESVSWEINPDETPPMIANFQVMQDGTLLEFAVSQQPNPKGSDKPDLPWASFQVSYPPHADSNLTVSYLTPLTQAIKGSELALYYVFQTGAGWDGPIGQAELIVNLPYPASSNTLMRISPQDLSLPYPMANPSIAIPSSAVMQGTQARWEWKDFEPTAQDDFALWLVNPGLWQQLQDAKAAVQANSQSGQAWLDLAVTYHNLATSAYYRPSIFSDSYLEPGIEAYREAIELLPENPTPHTGIALLTLSQYMAEVNAPTDAMQFINDQIQLAKNLETQQPELRGGFSSTWADDALSWYYAGVTATADTSASSTAQARQSQVASVTSLPSLTPSPLPSLTPAPSATPSLPPASPTPTGTPQPASADFFGRGMSAIIILAACSFSLVVILVILGIALVRRSPQAD